MRIAPMLVVVLGIAAIENGCGNSLGNFAAASLASIPRSLNGTEIGAEASTSDSSTALGCDFSACEQSGEECVQCVQNLMEDIFNHTEASEVSQDDEDNSCDVIQNEYCAFSQTDTCLGNEENVAFWECVTTSCEVDATCSGAVTIARFSGGIVLFSAAIVGLLSVGIDMA